jgi:hypothetical protein
MIIGVMVPKVIASRLFVSRILTLAGLILSGSLLRADIIYSNFGSGYAYYPGSGVVVTNGSEDYSVAIELPALTADYYLSGIEFVATVENPDPSNTVTMSIYADDGGAPGGSPLESLTLNGQIYDFNGSPAPVLTAASQINPELYSGANYWVVMDGAVDEGLVWDLNSSRTSGYVETDGTPGNWVNAHPQGTNGAVEVDGTLVPGGGSGSSVPEPGSCVLVSAGLLALNVRTSRGWCTRKCVSLHPFSGRWR